MRMIFHLLQLPHLPHSTFSVSQNLLNTTYTFEAFTSCDTFWMWDNTVGFSVIFTYMCASKFALILSPPWMLNLFPPLLVEFEARLMAEVVWLHLVATCVNHHRPQPDHHSSLANRNPPQSDSMFMIGIMKVNWRLPSLYLSCRLISDLRQSIRKRDGNRRRWIVSKHQSGQKAPIKCRCDWFVGR